MSLENPSSRKSIERRVEESDQEKERTIRGTYSFDQLYAAIDKVGSIKGSQELFQPADLKEKIDRVRTGQLDIIYITRTFGLRETVSRLLEPDERDPKPKPPFQATVALELPSEEVAEEPPLESGEPKDPSPFDGDGVASAEKAKRPEAEEDFEPSEPDPSAPDAISSVELPEAAELNEDANDALPDPVPELTLTEEESNLLRIGNSTRRFFPFPGEAKKNARYRELVDREKTFQEQYSKIAYATSFQELQDGLNSTNSEKKSELLSRIEKVLNGTGSFDSLPQSLRIGAENVLATQAKEKLSTGEAVALSPVEWEGFLAKNQLDRDYLGNRTAKFYSYPAIGALDVRTKQGSIDGELLWADEEKAIFKIGDTFLQVPMDEIVMSNGKTYEEIKKETAEEEARRRGGSSSIARPLPN